MFHAQPGLLLYYKLRTSYALHQLQPDSKAYSQQHMALSAFLHAGVRLGCYGPIKEAMGVTSENRSLVRKIAAGSISGGFAAVITNPLDLIKTRMQSKNNPHKTMLASTKSVLAEGGVKGLWRGSGPSMVGLIIVLQTVIIS